MPLDARPRLHFLRRAVRAFAFAAAPALLAAPASGTVIVDWVTVGSPGNAADAPATNCFAANCGAVASAYRIGKYEVTNAQYAEFLNAKAAADPLALYDTNMDSSPQGGIARSGTSGSFAYTAKSGFANKPVTFVSFFDAVRFANWLNNGQGNADTETGAYTLLGGSSIPNNFSTVGRNAGASIFLPSESEWYKAAYYDGIAASYFDYPAGSNAAMACAAPGATANTANCENAASGLTDVGAYTGSASPWGTFDQGGNVVEWNEQIVSSSIRGARGGTWEPASHGPVDLSATFRSSTGALGGANWLGFRVASAVPEPGTGLLVLVGLAPLAARRRG
jgi:formylglycine-generating enzyme required for sulfatase activity